MKPSIIRLCENILKGILLLSVFLPLFVFDPLLFPFVFPRTIVFRVLMEIGVILYGLLLVLEPRYRLRFTPLLTTLTILIGVFALTGITGINPYHSFWSTVERSEGIITWLHLGVYAFLLRGMLHNIDEWKELLRTVVIAGWIQTVYAFGQLFGLQFALISTGSRLSGSIGNPSFLAAYLLLVMGCTALLLATTAKPRSRVIYATLLVLDAILIWHTQTRGAVIALAIGLLWYCGVILWGRYHLKSIVALCLGLLLLATGAVLLSMNRTSAWVQQSETLNRLATISPNDITTQNRLIVWNVGIQGFLARPMLGWGMENFSVPFNRYFDPAIARDIGSNPWYDRAHNVLIEIANASGLLGLAAYAGVIVWALLAIRRLGKKSSTEAAIFGASFVAYMVQNLFVFDTLNSYVVLLILLALLEYRIRGGSVPAKTPPTSWSLLRAPLTLRVRVQIAVIATILSAVLMYYSVVRPTLANYYLVQGAVHAKEQPALGQTRLAKSLSYTDPAAEEYRFAVIQYARDQIGMRGVTPETTALARFAIFEMRNTLLMSPHTIQGYILLAELYHAASVLDAKYLSEAEAVAREALARAPRRYQAYTTLGRIHMSQGRPEEGIQRLKEAVALNDEFAEGHWNLGIAYILTRQPELAKQAFDAALARGFNVYDEKNIGRLLAAYQDSRDLQATVAFLNDLTVRFPHNTSYRAAYEELNTLYTQALEAAR